MNGWEPIDHTADAGIRVFGRSLEELFRNAARGMFAIIADAENITPKTEHLVSLRADGLEELLVAWLSELNHRFNASYELFSEFDIDEVDETHLVARARGERLDPGRHTIHTEIKAVTWHELSVRRTTDGYQANIIFDL